MKTISTLLLSFLVIMGIQAQDFNVPKDYKLEKAEDYALYEQDVLNGINWLMEVPLDEMPEKRQGVNAFVMKWLMGTPYLHLEIKQQIVTFAGVPELLMMFLGGWAKYSIENKDYNNKVAGNLAGIEAAISFYKKNSLPKNKEIENYIKMKENGKLKEYIEKNV